MADSTPRVYVIDDDDSARNGLLRLLRAAGWDAAAYASASTFLEEWDSETSGCIILDVRMPEMTGPELQEQLSLKHSCLPIIFLSAHGDVPTAASTMKKGAIDFLTKPVDGDELLKAIEDAVNESSRRIAQRAEVQGIKVQLNELTPREFEVMTHVIGGRLNKQIAASLNIAEDTVKIHRGRVMQKLGVASVADLVRLCEKAGIPPVTPD